MDDVRPDEAWETGRDAIAVLLALYRKQSHDLEELYAPYAEGEPQMFKDLMSGVAAVFFDVAERYRRPGDKTIDQALESHKWFIAGEGPSAS